MMTKRALAVIAVGVSVALLGGCPKKEEEATAPTPEATAAVTAVAPPDVTGTAEAAPAVGTCPGAMMPYSGTVRLRQTFKVLQAPDPKSTKLTDLGVGTFVDLKGACGNWMQIMYPSGVGQLSPGWIELRSPNDSRVELTVRDSGTPPPDASPADASAGDASAEPDAGAIPDAAAPADAGATPDGGRPIIRIPIIRRPIKNQ